MPANLEWAKPGNAGKKSSAEMGKKMKLSEIGRLVWLNLVQNKFKVFLTSTGIIVGSATIMLVIAIGTGGKLEVAEQFKNLNAGSVAAVCLGEIWQAAVCREDGQAEECLAAWAAVFHHLTVWKTR